MKIKIINKIREIKLSQIVIIVVKVKVKLIVIIIKLLKIKKAIKILINKTAANKDNHKLKISSSYFKEDSLTHSTLKTKTVAKRIFINYNTFQGNTPTQSVVN